MKYLFLQFSVFILLAAAVNAQTTNIVVLDSTEIQNLRVILKQNGQAKNLYDSIFREATESLIRIPQPVEEIHYEGLLENDPKRIKTTHSLKDIDAVVSLIYSSYGIENDEYGEKIKDFVLAWTTTFRPDGNPINENKLDALFWGYYLKQENGSSIKKSVEYVLPFATGEKQRKEWTNSKVKLDKERAAAGFEEYKPGTLFEPQKAFPLFEWACYYNPDWYSIIEKRKTEKYTDTWIGLLNSPLVRR